MNDDDLPKPLPVGTPSLSPAPSASRPPGTLPPPPPPGALLAGGPDATLVGLGHRVHPSRPALRGVAPGQALLDSLRPGSTGDTLVFPMQGLDRHLSTAPAGPLPRPLPPVPSRSPHDGDGATGAVDPKAAGRADALPASRASGRASATTRAPGRFPLRTTRPPDGRASVAAPQRRRSPDFIGLLPKVCALFAWFLVGVAGTFYDRAHPATYGLDMLFGVRRSLAIVGGDLVVARALLMVTVLVCVTGLAVNSLRMKRAGDRYNRSLIFLGVASVLGLVVDLAM